MIFVDTNVWMYAVGRDHPLKAEARRFFENAIGPHPTPLCTSAEVLQELLHAYFPVGRLATLDAALELVRATRTLCWPVDPEDVWQARELAARHAELGARDLLHLACCLRRGVGALRTFDRGLAAAFGPSTGSH